MGYYDVGYFKKNTSLKNLTTKRSILGKKRNIQNRIIAWKLSKEYYDGKRINGYGGFKYDGRWKKLLPKIIKRYNLDNNSNILDLGCKKGFIMQDLKFFLPKANIVGIENHPYPISKARKDIKKKILLREYYNLNFNKKFDFIIAFNSIYMQNLGDIIKTLKSISKISKKSLVTLASYEKEEDRKKFLNWTLLGTTILKKKDWKKLFKIINYKGDYYFSNANTLGL